MTGYELIYALGLIPARAGNTAPLLRTSARVGAHPRSRGEHTNFVTRTIPDAGSSPLARGTRIAYAIRFPRIGLIPARAGNTGTRH